MKTKTFFFICFLLGIATVQLSAAWPDPPKYNNGTGVVIVNNSSSWVHDDLIPYWNDSPAQLKSVSGKSYWHIEYVFKNGIPQFASYQVYGEFKSDLSGEVFKFLLMGTDYDNKGYTKQCFSLFGNKGSNYIIVATIPWGGQVTIDKFISFKSLR